MGKDFDFTAEWSCSFNFSFYEKKEIISIDSNKTNTLPKPLAKALRTKASTASTKSTVQKITTNFSISCYVNLSIMSSTHTTFS